MTCPECGTLLPTGARFCQQCGWDSKLAAAGKASGSAGSRPAWKRWITASALSILSVLVLWVLVMPRGQADAALIPGQPAPDFQLTSLDGEQVHLAELKGKPVIVNFWATWCTPCRKEMPDFQQVWDRYKDQGLQLYGINIGESKVGVADFRDKVGVNFPLLIDTKETVQSDYRILPLPATFFIDRNGIVQAVYQYQMTRAQMEAETLRLLSQ